MSNRERFDYMCSLYEIAADTDIGDMWNRLLQWRPAVVEYAIDVRQKIREHFGDMKVTLRLEPPFYCGEGYEIHAEIADEEYSDTMDEFKDGLINIEPLLCPFKIFYA